MVFTASSTASQKFSLSDIFVFTTNFVITMEDNQGNVEKAKLTLYSN